MIRTGDTIHNPVTGERITFLATSRDTDGEAVVIETVVQPKGFVAAAHVHPFQSERFAVVEGTLELKVGGSKLTLRSDEVFIVQPGTPRLVQPPLQLDDRDQLAAPQSHDPQLRLDLLVEGVVADAECPRCI